MENKELMISYIYLKVADKTLSFGCKCEYQNWNKSIIVWKALKLWQINIAYKWFDVTEKDEIFEWCNINNFSKIEVSPEEIKIIWHPVMIWDILDYFIWNKELNLNRLIWQNTIFWLLNSWKEKRKPIENQSDKCIEFIFNNLNLWQEKN